MIRTSFTVRSSARLQAAPLPMSPIHGGSVCLQGTCARGTRFWRPRPANTPKINRLRTHTAPRCQQPTNDDKQADPKGGLGRLLASNDLLSRSSKHEPWVAQTFATATLAASVPLITFGFGLGLAVTNDFVHASSGLPPLAAAYLRLFSTSFLEDNWVSLAAGWGVLAVAGPAAERVLGPARFAAIFLLSGAAKCVSFYHNANVLDFIGVTAGRMLLEDAAGLGSGLTPGMPERLAEELGGGLLSNFYYISCGPAAGVLGVAAAMAVTQLRNQALLTEEERSNWAKAIAATAVVAAASEQAALDASYGVAAAVGALLGLMAGPCIVVEGRYLDTWVEPAPGQEASPPADTTQPALVVDTTSGAQQWVSLGLFAVVLFLLLAYELVDLGYSSLELLRLMEEAVNPAELPKEA